MIEHSHVMRIKSLKGSGIIAIAGRHNLREFQSESGSESHINPLKTSLNVILRGAGTAAEIAAEAHRLMEQAKVLPLRTAKKDQWKPVVGLELLFSLPPDSGIAERDYFEISVAWAEKFFEIPILSAVIHFDEAAPHCHLLMLPLFNGRMTGSKLIGDRTRLLAMQADYYAKVGQPYGLAKQKPAKRYSATARRNATEKIASALRRNQNSLNDPAVRDALRDCLAESMPVTLLELLGLELPEPVTPKPKTFAGIMIQNKPEHKVKKYPIGYSETTKNTSANVPENSNILSCVGYSVSPPISAPEIQPEITSTPDDHADDFQRIRDEEIPANFWHDGECRQPVKKTRATSPAIEQTRAQLASLPNRWSA